MANVIFRPRQEIVQIQESNFQGLMDLVVERHPRYRRVLAESGLDRSDFRSLSDLSKLPPTFKSDYMAAPEEFRLDCSGLAPEMQPIWDVMHTAGTTGGTPTPFYNTTYDFFRILALQKSMMEIRGVTEADSIANLFPLTVWPHGAYARVPHAAAVMNIPVVSALPGNPSPSFEHGRGLDEVVRIVERSRATILWGVPSYVRRVLIRGGELGADFSATRFVFVTGEAAPEEMRRDLVSRLEALGASDPFVSISYGATELQGGMVEAAPGGGFLNPAPDQFFIEIVDPETYAPLPDGAPGLILLTHLDRRGTVLLRYALGDITARTTEPCPATGANTDRLTMTPQRADALVKIKGMLVDPAAIEALLVAHKAVTEYQIVIDRPAALEMDRLVLRLDLAEGNDAGEIVARVKDAVGVTPEIELAPRDEIFPAGDTMKSRRVVDLRAE